MRFPLDVFNAVKQEISKCGSNAPIGVRLSATDWLESHDEMTNSWTIEQSTEFCRQLEQHGCDFIDVSSGGISPHQQIKLKPGYQVEFAATIKQAVGLPVTAVGLITEPEQAEQIVADQLADAVMLGRGFLNDPRWPWRAASALGETLDAPAPYWRCIPANQANPFNETTYGTR